MRIAAIITLLLLLASVARADEASLRQAMAMRNAQYCYRFESWSENPAAPQFTLTIYFVAAVRPDGSYQGYAEGLPMPQSAEVYVESRKNGKPSTRVLHFESKRADEVAAWFGYCGFFAHDSDDPKHRFLDGKGLAGEKIVAGRYSEKRRSCEEDLGCRWLYDQLQALAKNG